MNQTIQSFFFKTICLILIINVTLCRSCFKLGCAASCYYSNNGFDYGYCENDGCKCSPPVIYLFNGIARGSNYGYIDNSWEYNNQNKNSITTSSSYYEHESETSTVHTLNENRMNKIWEEIVTKITKEYSFIKKDDLQNLKTKIIGNQSALNDFYIYLKNPLKDALELMKKKKPDTSKECDELLELLLKQENAKNTASLPKNLRPSQVFPRNLPIKQNTSVRNLTTSSPKNLATSNNSISKKPEGIINKNKTTNDKNVNNLNEKMNHKRTVVEEEEEKKHEVYYEISEETVEYSDESDETPKQNKETVTEKSRTQNKNKTNQVVPPIKNEIDNSSGSGSYYEYSSEEK